MFRCGPATSFARLNAFQARAVLSVLLLAALLFVGVSLSPLASGFADSPDRGPGDVGLYRAEVDRIGQGENYYSAAAKELRARGYPTRSIFNWRTPLPVGLIGWLPNPTFGKAVLVGLAILAACLAFSWLSQEAGSAGTALGMALLGGALLPCALGNLFVMPVLWSGVCIALSLAALGTNRTVLGVAAGIAALFLRELAAPYCLICFGMALGQRRRAEAAGWLAGFAAYAIYYAAHVAQVLPRIGPADIAHADGWLRFGGAGFVISTVQMNAFLLLLPQWLTALYLPLAMLGFAAWNTNSGRRAAFTAAAYVAGFAMVGHDFNQYWGSMIAPLMALGTARLPAAIRDLLSAGQIAQTALPRSTAIEPGG
jgi:hypothetical protein